MTERELPSSLTSTTKRRAPPPVHVHFDLRSPIRAMIPNLAGPALRSGRNSGDKTTFRSQTWTRMRPGTLERTRKSGDYNITHPRLARPPTREAGC